MSVSIIIGTGEGERRFDVAPYKLRELRLAAPFVEQMNEVTKRIDEREKAAVAAGLQAKEGQKLDDLFAFSRLLCEIVAIGTKKIDPAMDADAIEAEIDLTYIGSLQIAVKALLMQSGLHNEGEAKAPASGSATELEMEPISPSTPRSEELSPS